MEKTLKVLAWVQVVLGGLAIISWAGDTSDGYGLIGGALFLTAGIVALNYIASKK
jgi:threonine/homoserine efflux transporter RhtA